MTLFESVGVQGIVRVAIEAFTDMTSLARAVPACAASCIGVLRRLSKSRRYLNRQASTHDRTGATTIQLDNATGKGSILSCHVNVYVHSRITIEQRGAVLVTIKDVARESDVSIATVSRAINGHGGVTDETRARIVAIAARMRYVPDSAARSLITGRTHTIGVLLPDLHGEFFSEIIRGIDQKARLGKWHLLVTGVHDSADDAAQAIRALRGRVDGLLIMSPHANAAFLEANLNPETPTVLMNTRVSRNTHSAILVDNRGGAHAIMKHLVSMGHRRIAFLTGPEKNFDAVERLQGYRDALRELMSGASEQVLQGDFSEDSGYRVGKSLASSGRLPDAVFAANDSMAIGCLFALKEAGLNVPADIALAGFDDIPIARFMSPPLTTVHVTIADLGARALDRLTGEIATPGNRHSTETLATELVVRASSGALKSAASTPRMDAARSKKNSTRRPLARDGRGTT